MRRKVPRLRSDEDAERFLEQDLTDYIDRRALRIAHFELRPKDKLISLRLSQQLLDAAKDAAERDGISYQKFIRHAVEEAVSRAAPKR